jgi:hypothetical protein
MAWQTQTWNQKPHAHSGLEPKQSASHHDEKNVRLDIPSELCSSSASAGTRVDTAKAPTMVEAARFSLWGQTQLLKPICGCVIETDMQLRD